MTTGTMTLVCNRRSGKGGVARALPVVEAELERRGLDYDIRFTEGPGHATQITREVLGGSTRLVVAVGGDGTIHEVVNGMIDGDRAVRPEAALGVIAAGTGSDFIKTFGLPTDPAFAVRHLEGTNMFPIDIGRITYQADGEERTRYFANIAEAGIGAAVVKRAASLPRWLGPTVYLVAFWMTILKHRAASVRIDLVDRTYEGPMNNLVVANCQYFGGGMRIAPKAVPTDALLDIQIEHARKRDAIGMMPKIFKGQHLPHPQIKEAKRVRVSIESDRPLPIEADGEVLGYTPASFEVLPEVINLKA